MQRRSLGRTGLLVSPLAFGAGPISGLMTGADGQAQLATVRRAVECGINWFDTAAGYGQGTSETSLGQAIRELRVEDAVHVATKVRVPLESADAPAEAIRRSFAESLQRLQLTRVTLLQLHNGITTERGQEPFSLSPADVLGRQGVLEVFQTLRAEGRVDFFGLTGTGHPQALRKVLASGGFDTIQIPYHLLNPTAGTVLARPFPETDYGNILQDCQEFQIGVLAIRVFAGGALLGHEPSPHTLTTPFFPLELFRQDRGRTEILQDLLGIRGVKELAVRFVLSHPAIHAALIGFGAPAHIDEAVWFAEAGPLDQQVLEAIRRAWEQMS
jgi:aryl-alcohol dehydrogenase-like predicted oxidoreductase